MRWMLAGLAALMLAGCGFRPMYAPSADGGGANPPISVATIDGKTGHVLRAELTRMLGTPADAASAWLLEVQLTETVNRLGYRIDESAQRADLVVTANYTLEPAGETGEPLTGRITSTVSYDIPLSAFGEIAAQDDARERAGENLAQLLRIELAHRFASPATP